MTYRGPKSFIFRLPRAEVGELQGVLATGATLEECRDQLAEVVEEWVLVRIASRKRVDAALGADPTPRARPWFARVRLRRSYSGGRHQFMVKGDLVVTIPNPHGSDIGVGLLARVLRQAGITRVMWLARRHAAEPLRGSTIGHLAYSRRR